MQKIIQINQTIQNMLIQECAEIGGIKLTVNSMRDGGVLRLSTQQARALACDLIQHAQRAETIQSLKSKKFSSNLNSMNDKGTAIIQRPA